MGKDQNNRMGFDLRTLCVVIFSIDKRYTKYLTTIQQLKKFFIKSFHSYAQIHVVKNIKKKNQDGPIMEYMCLVLWFCKNLYMNM